MYLFKIILFKICLVYDKNEDGTLSFTEFMMFMHDINPNLPVKDIKVIF